MTPAALTPKREKYYVYELIDPRCGSAFYVSKGCGNRLKQHARAVRAGRIDNVEKFRRIKAIHDAGLVVIERIVSEHATERMAYAAERVAIEAMHPGLTNIVLGTKTNAEVNAERAKLELERTKTFDEWQRTILAHQLQGVGGVAGMRAFYDDHVNFLRSMAEAV